MLLTASTSCGEMHHPDIPNQQSSLAHAASPVTSVQLEALQMGFDQMTVDEAMKNLGNKPDINLESLVQAVLEIQQGQASGYQNTVNNIDIGSLTLENRQLKDKTNCKMCVQRQVNIVFVPCGHLVCCTECSSQITHCPICLVQIFKKINVYI